MHQSQKRKSGENGSKQQLSSLAAAAAAGLAGCCCGPLAPLLLLRKQPSLSPSHLNSPLRRLCSSRSLRHRTTPSLFSTTRPLSNVRRATAATTTATTARTATTATITTTADRGHRETLLIDMDKCTIFFGDKHVRLKPEKVSGENLKKAFTLDFIPDRVVERISGEHFVFDLMDEPLQVGVEYTVQAEEQKPPKGKMDEPKLAWLTLNAAVVAEAVYKEDSKSCDEVFVKNKEHHSIFSYVRSQHGNNRFLIAEDSQSIFVGICGTKTTENWLRNVQASFDKDPALIGNFHQGFLKSADEFPMTLLIEDENYSKKELVFCGHSAGGTIAAIIMIKLAQFYADRLKERSMTCITFGAPSFADATMQIRCRELDIESSMFHYVNEGDLVASILSYALYLSSNTSEAVRAAAGGMGQILSLVNHALTVCGIISGGTSAMRTAESIVATLRNVCQAIAAETGATYENIGNFTMITTEGGRQDVACTKVEDKVKLFFRAIETANKDAMKSLHHLKDNHVMVKYQSLMRHIFRGRSAFGHDNETPTNQSVKYHPKIESASLCISRSMDEPLKHRGCLVITGESINFAYCVKEMFKLSVQVFQNGQMGWESAVSSNPKHKAIRITGEVLEELSVVDKAFSFTLSLYTLFGSVEEFRATKIYTVTEMRTMMDMEDITNLLQKTFQRCLFFSAWGKKNGIVPEVYTLAQLTMGKGKINKLREVLEKQTMHGREYLPEKEDQQFADEMADVVITFLDNARKDAYVFDGKVTAFAGRSLSKVTRVAVWLLARILGQREVNYSQLLKDLNSQLMAFGAAESDKEAFGAAESDKEAFGAAESDKEAFGAAESDKEALERMANGSVPEMEKAAAKMWLQLDEKWRPTERDNRFTTMFSKRMTWADGNTIMAVRQIHLIRTLLDKQAILAITGHEKTGKTRLLSHMPSKWNGEARPHSTVHTTTVTVFQAHEKMFVLDCPGTNNKSDYCNLFSRMGSLNNMIILVMKYEGDINTSVTDDIVDAFIQKFFRLKGMELVVCINKCLQLVQDLANDTADNGAEEIEPLEMRRDTYALKIAREIQLKVKEESSGKECILSDKQHQIIRDSIMFTDWSIDCATEADKGFYAADVIERGRKLGIVGVRDVKMRMKQFVMGFNVFSAEEEEDVMECLEILPPVVAEDEQQFLVRQQQYLQHLSTGLPSVQKTPDRKTVGSPGVQGSPKKGVLASFFNSLLSKKTGQGIPGQPGAQITSPGNNEDYNAAAALRSDAATELDRLTRTQKKAASAAGGGGNLAENNGSLSNASSDC